MIEPRPLTSHHVLPPCSMVVTSSGLLVAKITSVGDFLYGLIAYICDDDASHASMLWGRRWQRTLNLPGDQHDAIIAARAPHVLLPGMGKIVRVDSAMITGAISTRDPELLAEHAGVLHRMADWLTVPPSALGVYGSAVYKPADARSDLDFVIYGERHCRTAWQRIRPRLPDVPRMKSGRPYHLHFPDPDGHTYLDPRFIAAEDYTAGLVTGGFAVEDSRPLPWLDVVDDSGGIFYPSRYLLGDGSVLLSYRLGHSAWLRTGDRVCGPPLPVLVRGGVRYRAVLRCESLTVHRR